MKEIASIADMSSLQPLSDEEIKQKEEQAAMKEVEKCSPEELEKIKQAKSEDELPDCVKS